MTAQDQLSGQPAAGPSLLRRAVLANGAVLVLAFVLLLATPVTVSAPIRAVEIAVLAVGIAALFATNLLLMRRALAPLRDLASEMGRVDLRDPRPVRLPEPSGGEPAVFLAAFNAMLERLAEERRTATRAALVAQERERIRVARALHDEAGQTLTAVALELERLATDGPETERAHMADLAFRLHDTLDEIRRITRELRPEALDDLGLVNALIALTTRVSQHGRISIERRLSAELPPLSAELEVVIYRVAQEALTNVLRHADASRCLVSLRASGSAVTLQVVDDGRGLPMQPPAQTVGLEGMRERAALVGGTLAIDSKPGEGVTVTLRVEAEEA